MKPIELKLCGLMVFGDVRDYLSERPEQNKRAATTKNLCVLSKTQELTQCALSKRKVGHLI